MERPNYRPDIDGLRAIAVLGVLFCHLDLFAHGGYVGVDVFFVISGYLITKIILREMEQDAFSITKYWQRRITRLSPALLLVVSVTLFTGVLLLQANHLKSLGQSIFTLFLFHSNIFFYKNTGYFDVDASAVPLLHTWSLSIEEQFYIVFPILALLSYKFLKSKGVFSTLLFVFIASFGWSLFTLYGEQTDRKAAYYLLENRAWEMALGGIVSFFAFPEFKTKIANTICSLLGLSGIIIPYFFYSDSTLFPGFAALAPCAATALIILQYSNSNNRYGFIYKSLSNKVLVMLGLISYPLYLWHWPIIVYLKSIFLNELPLSISLGAIGVSGILAYLTYKFIEQPIRRGRFLSSGLLRVSCMVSLGIALCIAGRFVKLRGLQTSFLWLPEHVKIMADSIEDKNRNIFRRKIEELQKGAHLDKYGDLISDPSPSILFWGDSHAYMLSSSIEKCLNDLKKSYYAVGEGGVPPLFDFDNPKSQDHLYAEEVFKRLDGLKIETVILASRWACRMNDLVDQENVFPSTAERGLNSHELMMKKRFERTLSEFQKRGIHVIIIRQVPVHWVVPENMALFLIDAEELNQTQTPTLEEHHSRKFSETLVMSPLIRKGVDFIELSDAFLSESNRMRICDSKGRFFYYDNNHLTKLGAKQTYPLLKSGIVKILNKE